ncbi:MAG: hypothetical protein WAZ34_05240 [Rhodocyclaceae bacterium]
MQPGLLSADFAQQGYFFIGFGARGLKLAFESIAAGLHKNRRPTPLDLQLVHHVAQADRRIHPAHRRRHGLPGRVVLIHNPKHMKKQRANQRIQNKTQLVTNRQIVK